MCAFAQAALSIYLASDGKLRGFTVNGLAFLFSGTLIAVFYHSLRDHMPQLDMRFGILLVVIGAGGNRYRLWPLPAGHAMGCTGSQKHQSCWVLSSPLWQPLPPLFLRTTFSIADLIGFAL